MLDPTTFDDSPCSVLPTYPIELIPGDCAELFGYLAEDINIPVEMIALPFLAAVSATVGRKLWVYVGSSWERENPVLWTAYVARPGSRKTAGGNAGLEQARGVWRLTASERQGLPMEVSNMTVEALTLLLNKHDRGVLLYNTELAASFKQLNAYRAGSDREFMLAAHDGSLYEEIRKGIPSSKSQGGLPVHSHVEEAYVAVSGAIQRLPLAEFYAKSRGSGLFERFLWSVPAASEPKRMDPTNWDYGPLKKAISKRLLALYEADPGAIPLSSQAKARYWDWHYEMQLLTESEPDESIAAFQDKSAGQVIRLALLLHALEHGKEVASKPIQRRSIDRAIRLADYHLAHAREALWIASRRKGNRQPIPSVDVESRVLEVLGARGDWVSKTELWDAFNRSKVTRENLDTALNKLEAEELIESKKGEAQLGRPPELYRIRQAV